MSKYYAVKVGRKPGLYTSWEDCKDQIHKFPNAVYKSFKDKEDAQAFLEGKKNVQKEPQINQNKNDYITSNNDTENVIAYVDGSFNKNTNIYGYGVVLLYNGQSFEYKGCGNDPEAAKSRNVAGELNGAMRAITETLKIIPKPKSITIYYDYSGIEMWANGNWKTNKKETIQYLNFINAKRKEIEINFVKVTAHSQIPLNEAVDKLAKEAVGIN